MTPGNRTPSNPARFTPPDRRLIPAPQAAGPRGCSVARILGYDFEPGDGCPRRQVRELLVQLPGQVDGHCEVGGLDIACGDGAAEDRRDREAEHLAGGRGMMP
jgi:hypothetical protein